MDVAHTLAAENYRFAETDLAIRSAPWSEGSRRDLYYNDRLFTARTKACSIWTSTPRGGGYFIVHRNSFLASWKRPYNFTKINLLRLTV